MIVRSNRQTPSAILLGALLLLSASVAGASSRATAPGSGAARAPTPSALGQLHRWDGPRIVALARHYARGEGVPHRASTAFALYCLAAGRGDAEAAYALGRSYLNGRRGAIRDGLARHWLQRAADRGNERAQPLLKRLDQHPPRHDDNCPLPGQRLSSRQQARRWARALAGHYRLDPALVEVLIETESSFDSRALSPKNAHGLMQLIPATASRFGVQDINDPVDNLRGGMAYLSWLLKRFDQQLPLALAAYNAGENAVDRYQGIPPYRETQRYVERILSRYQGGVSERANTLSSSQIRALRRQRLARLAQ